MSDQPSSARVARALLRLSTGLAGHVDPLEGGDGRAMRRLAEELREVLEDTQGTLDPDVVRLLSSAQSTLSSSESTLPYVDCLSAHFAIARTLSNTNLALTRTCTAFYAAVAPILAAEIHLFTAGQLERVAARFRSDRKLKNGVRELTVRLELAEITEQRDQRWAGRFLVPLIESLASSKAFTTLHLRFRAENGCEGGTEAFQSRLFTALGLGESDWWDLAVFELRGVRDLVLPSVGPVGSSHVAINALLRSGAALERVQIGSSAFPYHVSPEDIAKERSGPSQRVHPFNAPQLRSLAIPFFTFFPGDLSLLAPDNAPPPPLERLELSIRLDSPATDGDPVAAFLGRLAPSLRHLSLRFRGEGHSGTEAFKKVLLNALADLELESLEIGGHPITEVFFIDVVERVPSLRHLTMLPTTSMDFDHWQLIDACDSMPSSLRTFTVCTPSRGRLSAGDAWGAGLARRYLAAGDAGQPVIKLEDRAAEYRSLEE
ncbi:hypothetical protein JCM10213_005151 [Rhodosporidiobolus nylandii]